MPPHTPRPGGRLRRALLVVALIALAIGVTVLYALGGFLYYEDPLQRADAVFVLAGTRMERQLEAADLFREGYTPVIVLPQEQPDGGMLALATRGVHVPDRAEVARSALVRSGIPERVIIVPPRLHDNTAQEADSMRTLALQHGWRRVIVVTSKFHTRRAHFALRRELEGTSIEVIMRATRYDDADPRRWWRRRKDVRFAVSEAGKLVAYVFGLGE